MPTLEVGSYTLSPSLMATEKEVRVNLDSIDVIDREERAPLYFVNCMTVRHVFIMEQLALMIYSFFMQLVHCLCPSEGYHHWGYQKCVSISVRERLYLLLRVARAPRGYKCHGRFFIPVRH